MLAGVHVHFVLLLAIICLLDFLVILLRNDRSELVFPRLLRLEILLLRGRLHATPRVDLGEEESQDAFSVFPVEVVQVDLVGEGHIRR